MPDLADRHAQLAAREREALPDCDDSGNTDQIRVIRPLEHAPQERTTAGRGLAKPHH
jgi:hypothetical protein